MILQIVPRTINKLGAATTITKIHKRGTQQQPSSTEENPGPPLTVKQAYKNLLHLGKDFPKGYEYFRDRCKSAFLKNREVSDPQQVDVLLARAVYVTKELEALYMLKKYRTLKKRYYSEELK